MKHLASLLLIIPALAASAQDPDSPAVYNDSINIVYSSDNQAPRIVLRAEDGSFPEIGKIDDSNSIRMAATPDGYLASDVDVSTGGLLFFAPLPSDSLPQEQWEKVYYYLPFWAERPLLIRYLNPLLRLPSTYNPAENYIELKDGTYDIHYFTRKNQETVADQFYELFSIVDANDTLLVDQPREMFLVNMYNESVSIPESSPGVYEARINLPDEYFKVCYESSGFYIPAFAFGPANVEDSALEGEKICNIAYGTNTNTTFTYSSHPASRDNLLKPGEDAYIVITLDGANSTMVINPAHGGTELGINGVDASPLGEDPVYFTPAGIRVDRPSAAGLYILRRGAAVKKVFIR